MLASIQLLREISRRCLNGEPLDQEHSRWLGESLTDFLHHRCTSLEDALGLHFPRGGVPWWREEAIRKRDAALRQLAERFLHDLAPAAQARRIYELSLRYAASAWLRDRAGDDMPPNYAGQPHEFLWCAFASAAAMPIGERQLRHILGR